jgi:cell division septal protein FtsQ
MKKKYSSKKHKEKKGKKLKLKSISYSFLFIFIIFGIGYITRLDNFKIKQVNITGTEDSYKTDLIKLVEESLSENSFFWLISRGSSFTYNKSKIQEKILLTFPKVDRLIIKKDENNILDIIISEKEAYYFWCTETCYLVDYNGIAFEVIDEQYTIDNVVRVRDDINNISLGTRVYKEKNLEDIKFLIKKIEEKEYKLESFKIHITKRFRKSI